MSIDETEVQPVNGVAHKRIRLEDPADHIPGRPEPAPVATVTSEQQVEHDEAEPAETPDPRRGLVAFVKDTAVHPHTKFAARQAAYPLLGVGAIARHTWESRSTARHERFMRIAEAAGNHEMAREWEERAARFRKERHQRRMELLGAPYHAVKATVFGGGLTFGGLIALGIMLAIVNKSAHETFQPLMDVLHAIEWLWWLGSVLWTPVSIATPFGLVGALYAIGRKESRHSTGWVSRLLPQAADAGIVVSADGIVQALKALPVKELKAAFKAGWVPTFATTPVKDGQGYRAMFELPLDVTPNMVADQRERFARALHRAPIEVWAVDADRKGTGAVGHLDLWVADRGVLNKPAPDYPLLVSGTADVFTGVPAGVTPRGDVLMVPVVGNNFVAGGMMGQGKSNACRVVMLGAALDPLCELRAYVFAGNGDFDAYRPRLSVYERGANRETIVKGIEGLRWLYNEVGRREDRLAALSAKKVTREIARKYPDLRPIAALFSECHELFGDKEFGEEAAELGVQTIRRARKTGIWLGFDTQSSRKDAIPPKIVELVSVNACFAVKSWRSNDGFLGDGSFQAGIRATELRPGTDRGRSLITGVSNELYEILNWFFVQVDDDSGWDAATDVIERAMKLLVKGTRAMGDATAEAEPERVERDILADLLEVLHEDEVTSAAQAVTLLRGLDPIYYGGLKKKDDLVARLGAMGHRIPSTGNTWPMTAELVRGFMAKGSDSPEPEDGDEAS
jgi:S-DNA-T family DNA segregation ATPase FtsK/SpoIIIE